MTASRASRLVLGSGGASSSDLVGDTLRWILPAAGVVLSLWVIAVPPPLPRILGVLATLAVATALGYRLRSGHAGHGLLPATWIVASAVVVWWAGTPPGLPLLFVLWSGAAAIGLTGRTGALAHMLLTAVALGAALALAPGPTPGDLRVQIWAMTMAGLISVGLLLRGLATTLRDVDERFGRAFEDASIGMAVADLDMRVIEPNPAFCALLGRTPEQIIGRRVRQFTHPDDRDVNVSLHKELASGRSSSYRLVKRYLRPDGGVVWAQITVSLVRDRRRRPRYVYAQIEDITQRRRAEAERERNSRALARRARLGEAAAELGRVALVVPGVTELADHMAHTVAECLGVEVCCVCQLDGDTLVTLGGVGLPDGRAAGRRFPLRERSFPALALATDGVLQVADVQADPRVDLSDTMRNRGVRGGLAVAVRDRAGDAGMIFAHDLDAREFDADEVAFVRVAGNVLGSAIERAKREADALHRAHHDPLTGLPNRDLFADRLGQALARARRGDAPPAVLLADLDQFKFVNDSLGHPAGDELLRAIAPRLAAAVRANDTVARFGGDEFVILGDGVGDELQAMALAGRLAAAFDEPFLVQGAEMYVTASIGVALAGPLSELDALLADADAALYRAKARGRARAELFDATMRASATARLALEGGLRRALEGGELHLHYQPLIDLESGRPVGVEALMRWTRRGGAAVSPADFIPVAEESGLILPFGRWALQEGCERLRSLGDQALGVSVNVSARQLAHPAFLADVSRALEVSGIEPRRLTLELTESALMDDTGSPLATLTQLRDLGVRLALDDFGTGYSSLAYLQRFPLDCLKVDRAFVAGLGHNARADALLESVLGMARALGLLVVAEGVETRVQLDALRRLGCPQGQGFLLSRPLPGSALEAYLESSAARAS